MIIRYTIIICLFLFSFNALAQQSPGFVSVEELTPLPVARNTGEKPQSKVWTYACRKWAVLADQSGTHLWRLDGKKWNSALKLSDKLVNADCKVVDSVAHILLFTGKGKSYLVSLEYSTESGTYEFWSERPSPAPITLAEGAKTATIDIDGTGRMWLASDDSPNITVQWSDAPYASWSKPIQLETNTSQYDIGGVIAMPGKVGVLWSNLKKQRFGFKVHNDGDAPEEWSEDEVAASQSALNIYLGMADDHLNMAVASDGTLYCAVKTEYDTRPYPKIALLVRRPNGKWDNLYEVSQKGTRPIVILNEEKKKIKVIYTSSDLDADIVYKESHSTDISFSPKITLIKGAYNNATSSKDNYTSDVVILASDSTQAVGVLASDGSSPNDPCIIPNVWTAYPNPFSPETNVYFTLPESGSYTLNLYDSRGAHVMKIMESSAEAGRMNTVKVDGTHLATGMYIVRLQANGISKSLKIVLGR